MNPPTTAPTQNFHAVDPTMFDTPAASPAQGHPVTADLSQIPPPPSTDNLVLDEAHRTQLDGIVGQMIKNGEPDPAIRFVVGDFKQKYGTPTTADSSTATTPPVEVSKFGSVAGASNSPLSAEGETNLGNALGKVFPGADLGKAVGSSAYSIGQLLSGAYHTITGNHDKATENFNRAFGGAASGSDINKAFADAIQIGLTTAPGIGEGGELTQATKTGVGLGEDGNLVLNSKTALGLSPKTTLIAKIGAGAATGYGFDVTQKVKDGSALNDAGTYKPGLATAIGGSLPFATALIGSLGKTVTGFTSGTGAEVLDRAAKNPDAVYEAVQTYAKTPEAKQSLVSRAQAAISDFLSGNQDEYSQKLKGLNTQAPLQPEVALQTFSDSVNKFGGKINDEGDLVFKNTALSPQDQRDLKTAWDTISNWSDNSVQGMDNLRQAVDNLMNDFKLQGNARANLILGGVKQAVVSHIAESTPGYVEMLNSYGQKSQTASALIKELNLGGQARPSTQLNNIMRLFQKDPSVMEKVSSIMGPDKAEAFMNELSGAILSDWIPAGRMGNYIRGLGELGATTSAAATAGIPAAIGTAAIGAAGASPRVVGTGARLAGRAAKAGVGPVLRKVATYFASKANH